MTTKSFHIENEEQLLDLARQGVPEAIAAIMNYYFNPKGIEVSVGWNESHLLIVCESPHPPQQKELVQLFERILVQLGLSHLQSVRVYGRIKGEPEPLWSASLEITQVSPIDLSHWLAQGAPQPLPKSKLGQTPPININAAALNRDKKQRFLRFSLGNLSSGPSHSSNASSESSPANTALFPLAQIQEILHVPVGAILSVPHMLACVLGVYNYRSNMLWLVDLTQQLGDRSFLSEHPPQNPLPILVLRHHDNKHIGLVVPQVLDIESYVLEQIQPIEASLFPPLLRPFIAQYLPQSLSPILSIQALLQDAQLRTRPV